MSALQPVQHTTAAGQVTDQLEQLILDGTYTAGSSLPSESELAQQLGVSRLTVREATKSLQARNLIQVQQGRRPVVLGLNGAMLGEFFDMAIRRDERAVLEVLEVRRGIEVHAARLAARRGPGAAGPELDAMRKAVARMRRAEKRGDEATFHDADVEFHEGLAAAAGVELLRLLVNALHGPLRASRSRSLEGHQALGLSLGPVIQAHDLILERVADADEAGAAAAMIEHLVQTERDLRAALDRGAGQPHAAPPDAG